MSFAAAVEHLHALGHELAAPTAPRRKFDLEHMRILARALGDPQQQFPAILIAGTNGKGSTAATLAAILSAAGYRAGLYTSPHLSRVTERIRTSQPATEPGAPHLEEMWDGPPRTFTEIPEEDFARLYFRVDEAANQLVSAGQLPHHPSFFETLTALAFLYFSEQRLDIAILEVGMGGRLDATNIIDPVLSVITDIALDHQEYLGSTIAAIAREKTGILRPNGTLITLPQHPEANHAIGEAAIALNVHAISATDYLPGRNFAPSTPPAGAPFMAQSHRDMGGVLPANEYILTLDNEPLKVRSPLAGEHQQRNIALAIAAAIELRNYFSNKSILTSESRNHTSYKSSTAGLEPRISNLELFLPISAIEAGIANTSWPGRLEFLPPNLLLDVAHNPSRARSSSPACATRTSPRWRRSSFPSSTRPPIARTITSSSPPSTISAPPRSTTSLAPPASSLSLRTPPTAQLKPSPSPNLSLPPMA
jgi:dihydrofolate synthase/folylpolyglutamate synthase